MIGAAITETEMARVLVIEDDADTRENLRDILELDHFLVDCAASIAEALARDNWSEVAAVILDRQLPDGNAHDVLPTLRDLAPEAAVIIVTGYSDLEGAIEALRLGAADYILKPINGDSLRLRISGVVEKRRLSRAKERSDAVFRMLVEVAECMIVMLTPDHIVSYFSPFAEQLTGYSSEEVIGRDFFTLFIPEEDREEMAGQHREILSGELMRGAETRILCRGGTYRWVLRNARCLRNQIDSSDDHIIMLVAHDITELKQAQDRAVQAGRLAAIGNMVAGLAHESRNALQRSQACLDMLALKVSGQPDAMNLIGRIQNAQDDLQRLFEDVRNYAAPIRLERRECNLQEIWQEAWANLDSARRGRTTSLSEKVNCKDLFAEVDPFRIGQVFRNILDNSLAACSDPVHVRVSATETKLYGAPAIRISFHDNGPGFFAEQRARIFDAFYTTKTKGTGLGMAITKRIIDGHGGLVEVGTSEGPGAEIVVTLPRRGNQ